MARRLLFDGALIELGLLPLEAPPAPPSGTQAFIRVSGVWQTASVFIKVAGVWQPAQPFWKDSGAWY
jgi:hypothetical protein